MVNKSLDQLATCESACAAANFRSRGKEKHFAIISFDNSAGDRTALVVDAGQAANRGHVNLSG